MKIISISGLDGSGKSTQIEMLKKHLEAQGKKVFYFHGVQFSIANVMNSKKKFNSAKSVTKASFMKIELRKIALAIDIFRFKILFDKLSKDGYDYLLSDRYFYDNIINISYLQHKNSPLNIAKFIPAADKAFYLQIEPEVTLTRSRVPDQGLEYLKEKKKLYDKCATLWNLQIVDGSQDMNTIQEKILDLINRSQL